MAVSTKPGNKRKFEQSKPVKVGNNKIKFTDDEEDTKPVNTKIVFDNGEDTKPMNKKIVFDDDGESVAETKPSGKSQAKKDNKKAANIGIKWYEEVRKRSIIAFESIQMRSCLMI